MDINTDTKFDAMAKTRTSAEKDTKADMDTGTNEKADAGMSADTNASGDNVHQKKKTNLSIGNLILFAAIMGLTLYAVFREQDFDQIAASLQKLSAPYLILAVVLALFFVCMEGTMIWYLLGALGRRRSGLLRCISYSFIGFFYSGITPSATGGQPMQLYYMNKDKNTLADSSVVLMTVAIIYKFVLAVIGTLMLVFWYNPLRDYMKKYFGLFFLGLALNVILVVILLAVMIAPNWMKGIVSKGESLLVRLRIFKFSGKRREKINGFIDGYQDAVQFLIRHKGKVAFLVLLTFLQRCSVFFLTAVIYKGFSQNGTPFLTVMLLQAAVVIAVDMLPLPGAQGISELLYCRIFAGVFSAANLMPSLYVTRGITFYFLLIVSLLVVAGNSVYRNIEAGRDKKTRRVLLIE